jgi:isopropylmalate/homocitrate/citramalate synthase
MGLRANVIAHARMDHNEIRVVKDLGLKWVGLFAGISEQSLRRYGMPRQEVYKRAGEAVQLAQGLGLRIKFACEDASRTDARDLLDFYTHLHSLGVDRLSYADTLGLMTPEALEHTRAIFGERMPFRKLHFHFHDDFGKAAENAVYAAQCGAQCIDASILGVGERAGLASLERVVALLNGNGGKEYKTDPLHEAAELVRTCINRNHYRNRRFAHKSGIHINGTIKDHANYESIDPDKAGAKRIFVLSKLIGKSGLQTILSRHGFHHAEKDLAALLRQVKSDDMLELAGPEEICRYFMERGLERQDVEEHTCEHALL